MSSPAQYVVGVRALCEFTAKRGDLDLRFTPSPTALEGMAGHNIVALRRGSAYQRELALAGDHKTLRVRGRADGYDADANRLEEIKTHRGALERVPENHRELHRAQAKVYGALLCRQLGLEKLEVALVYFDIATERETCFAEVHAAADLQAYFEAQCEAFLAWSEQELAHAAQREAATRALRFPHAGFRPGQRELAEGVYRAAVQQRCLVAQAPTGIGKTIGTIFPILKSWPAEGLDKVFFLTAKGSGRALGLGAMERLSGGGDALRTVELVARDKACEHPDNACHGDSCPLARGFYDRLPAARQAALARGRVLDQPALRSLALEHAVCPYYLGQELVRWADVVVGDYNHYFDLYALLHALATAHEWKVAVLVDEAHNLLDRARAMYSARLRRDNLRALARLPAPAAVTRALRALSRRWGELEAAQEAAYQAYAEVPAAFLATLQQTTAAIGEHLDDNPAGIDDRLLQFHFDALAFQRLADLFGAHALFDLEQVAGSAGSVLCLRNVVPAPHLQARFRAAHTTVLFSATLTPMHFHADMLGLPADTVWLDVPSPFRAEQLRVRVARDVSTRYRDRQLSLGKIVALLARQFHAAPGNYLAFFSSFEYLEAAAARLAAAHPEIPTWHQSRGMDAETRDRFLDRFAEDGEGIGFAVLGGSFGEGIDLPGRRLIGAFIATLGLPPLEPVNEEIRRRVEQSFGAGYDYTYLYPGVQKVVQAAGRVIRSSSDRGSVHLMDDRFQRRDVQRLLPSWWQVECGPAEGA